MSPHSRQQRRRTVKIACVPPTSPRPLRPRADRRFENVALDARRAKLALTVDDSNFVAHRRANLEIERHTVRRPRRVARVARRLVPIAQHWRVRICPPLGAKKVRAMAHAVLRRPRADRCVYERDGDGCGRHRVAAGVDRKRRQHRGLSANPPLRDGARGITGDERDENRHAEVARWRGHTPNRRRGAPGILTDFRESQAR